VTWGKHTGVPHQHSNNDFRTYCRSLGYPDKYGTPKYGTVKCKNGALFWCKGYDNPKSYHWCDWQDGRWKNNGLQYRCLDNRALIQFSCRGKMTTAKTTKKTTTKTTKKPTLKTFGYAKDSGQYTRCEQIVTTKSAVTCKNPRVTWGKHTGVPHQHSNNDFRTYCRSLGYPDKYGTPKYGTVKCKNGALFWCKGYDNPKSYHWCDWQDGRWKNNGLQYRCLDNRALIQFSCKPKSTGPKPGPGTFGYAKDSGQYTKCGQIVRGNGYVTCKNPRVTWGKHTGYPHKHRNNDFNNYCRSLGFTRGSYGGQTYGTVNCKKGALFWCRGYDNPKAFHWCDWQDGRWKNNGLHYRCINNQALTQFSCRT